MTILLQGSMLDKWFPNVVYIVKNVNDYNITLSVANPLVHNKLKPLHSMQTIFD